jgi:tetratricopeptide (TPR) repeat protein|tara:strand:- start:1402 stop:2103 length:702 start_codon:yes stop_codon:yes gene_type:complete
MIKIKYTIVLAFAFVMQMQSQNSSELLAHYQSYYVQMKQLGDTQGIINAMNHLSILEPKVRRQDTLAYIYMSEGKHRQAISLLGVEVNESDTDLDSEVKAISLKALNKPELALEHYEVLYKRKPSPQLAYELADLKIITDNLTGATVNISYGIAYSTSDMMKGYYESQTPYQVSLTAGFMYLKAIAKFRENPETNHEASITILEEALQLAPNFNLATIAISAIRSQKETLETK